MNIWLASFLIIWLVGAISGCIAIVSEADTNSEHYAMAIFWPLFLVIFILRGLFRALWHIND